jgi:hypothetical protein
VSRSAISEFCVLRTMYIARVHKDICPFRSDISDRCSDTSAPRGWLSEYCSDGSPDLRLPLGSKFEARRPVASQHDRRKRRSGPVNPAHWLKGGDQDRDMKRRGCELETAHSDLRSQPRKRRGNLRLSPASVSPNPPPLISLCLASPSCLILPYPSRQCPPPPKRRKSSARSRRQRLRNSGKRLPNSASCT